MEINYIIARMDSDFTELSAAIEMCGCKNYEVAQQIARTIARTIWQGHRVGVFSVISGEETVLSSFLYPNK